ncbi:alpha/beta hydrolase family protein [Lysobacter auxotrophicus]|uniref:Alpha/beta hydrolase n=1 Tax=Lysobacter auxotrophicus TaxID=2992573 RepID=A0ABM8DIH1_9GAMM|nr:alpha/beta hydrolase [Lysobacter auxotrophicus]BDU18443.1 alpha/beta hydrolase [Lysobacter auxotrophicus]
MRKVLVTVLVLVAVGAAAVFWWTRPERDKPIDPRMACHVGVYRLDDGRLVDIAPMSEPGLRWRAMDGRTGKIVQDAAGNWSGTVGWSDHADKTPVSLGTCEKPAMTFEGQRGTKLEFEAVETRFQGNGETLAGRLVMPPGDGPVPIAVMVHGSEGYSARTFNAFQRIFPAQGIGVFVYDKRGSGDSTGRYTQDFHLLADDAAAALKEARRLAGKRAGRVGFSGGSQAGWIEPLAAQRSDPDFVAVSYGLADSPLAEDRDQVQLDLIKAGFSGDALAKAREVTDATGEVIASGFKDGYDRLEALKAKYGKEPWWGAMQGEFTGDIVRHSPTMLRLVGPFHDEGTTWRHDPMPPLRAVKVPLLWILAGADKEAPPEETRRRLLSVAKTNPNVEVVEFPGTDHGIIEFETAADGERTSLRYADGYYAMLVDWIRDGALKPVAYGNAERLAPRAPDGPQLSQ